MTDQVGQLAESYRRALALRNAGGSHASIATALDIPVESVPALLEIAQAKLVRLDREATTKGETP